MRRTNLCAFAALTVALVVAALAAPANAQTTTGNVAGVVRDAGGGVMPGVSVKATHVATNAETIAVTNGEGLYVLRGLPVGRYTVVAELSGFQTAKNTNVLVRVSEDVRLDIAAHRVDTGDRDQAAEDLFDRGRLIGCAHGDSVRTVGRTGLTLASQN